MKKNATKRLLAVLMAGVMAFSLAACGGKDKGNADPNAPVALTEEEYQQAANDLGTKMSEIQKGVADAQTDPEAAKKILEDVKKTLSEFMELTPPESYAAGHEKIKSGCQAMIEVMDIANEMADMGEGADPNKLTEMLTTMQEKMVQGSTDLQEGAKLLDEADKK